MHIPHADKANQPVPGRSIHSASGLPELEHKRFTRLKWSLSAASVLSSVSLILVLES